MRIHTYTSGDLQALQWHHDSLTVQKALLPPTAFLPHQSADRRTTLGFLILILHTEVWIPKVSRDFLVRTIL